MTTPTPLTSLDTVFISYDEPNCEENYADLLEKVPWALRVHGVKGSDAAHKAAGKLSNTDRVITVDADNIVDIDFFSIEIDFEHPKFKDKVISWSAKNIINGLEYGNGGLKCWPVKYMLGMKTHEESESDNKLTQIDFCWEKEYVQMNNRYCVTHNNGSPHQAFRAGFREGVKMSINSSNGERINPERFTKTLWHGNLQRLLIWCSVGADVENGLWAMYGARLGCYMTVLTDWDYVNVRDFEYINNIWKEQTEKFEFDPNLSPFDKHQTWNQELLDAELKRLGDLLRNRVDLEIADLDPQASKFFKRTHTPLPRMGVYQTESEMDELRKLNQ